MGACVLNGIGSGPAEVNEDRPIDNVTFLFTDSPRRSNQM